MSRPKPTAEDAAAKEARVARYGRADADISDAEFEEIKRQLLARLLKERKRRREDRRRQKAALGRGLGGAGAPRG